MNLFSRELEATLDSLVDGVRYRVIFDQQPFAQGACKLAFKGIYAGQGPKAGKKSVTKIFKDRRGQLSYLYYRPDLKASQKASEMAQAFNSDYTSNKPLYFILPQIATVSRVGGGIRYVNRGDKILVEDFIEGRFEKFNSNSGWCSDEVAAIPAFSHYTFWKSNGEFLVCDIQGVRCIDGYALTDPAVHSRTQGQFGLTDLGPTGMALFLKRHRCTSICSRFPKPRFNVDWRIRRCGQQRRNSTYTFMLDIGEIQVNRTFVNRRDLPDIVEAASLTGTVQAQRIVGAAALLAGAWGAASARRQ